MWLGSIIPVTSGMMRNAWYPSGRAEYVTFAELREKKDKIMERDFLFAVKVKDGVQEAPSSIKTPDAKIQLLSVCLLLGSEEFLY